MKTIDCINNKNTNNLLLKKKIGQRLEQTFPQRKLQMTNRLSSCSTSSVNRGYPLRPWNIITQLLKGQRLKILTKASAGSNVKQLELSLIPTGRWGHTVSARFEQPHVRRDWQLPINTLNARRSSLTPGNSRKRNENQWPIKKNYRSFIHKGQNSVKNPNIHQQVNG